MKRLPLFALLAITSILFFGLRQSAEVVGDKLYIQRQKLRDALYGKSGFKGLSGTLTCSPRGNCTQPNIEIFRLTSNQRKPSFK